MRTLITITICLCLMIAGCGQVILRDPNGVELVKINTLLKDIKFGEAVYQDWLIKSYTGDSKNVKALTPYGTVETSDSNN